MIWIREQCKIAYRILQFFDNRNLTGKAFYTTTQYLTNIQFHTTFCIFFVLFILHFALVPCHSTIHSNIYLLIQLQQYDWKMIANKKKPTFKQNEIDKSNEKGLCIECWVYDEAPACTVFVFLRSLARNHCKTITFISTYDCGDSMMWNILKTLLEVSQTRKINNN